MRLPNIPAIKKALAMAGAFYIAALSGGCDHLDDDRIPWLDVRITFNTVGEWNTYGVSGALTHRRFIRRLNIPEGYPYTALTYTGFGGVLLVSDAMGNPLAYDLACPVEMKYDVIVGINPETNYAECPVCHSQYDVFMNYGAPVSGQAADKHYGLTRYRVGAGSQGEYMIVTH